MSINTSYLHIRIKETLDKHNFVCEKTIKSKNDVSKYNSDLAMEIMYTILKDFDIIDKR